jgi:uncharacterized protein (DUF342 family)
MGEPALTILGDVSLITGNVRHTGDVRISGSVLPGFVVDAGGNVLVMGDVRGAHVIAGGNVTVRSIAAGTDALIDAIGHARVGQAADCRILAGKDVEIQSSAERCDIAAGRRILLTGAPGALRGGKAQAGAGVEVSHVGASAGRPARIVVGQMPFDDGREQVTLRLNFAQNQATAAVMKDSDSPQAYRKKIKTVRAYRHLAVALERRLRQIEQAERVMNAPYLRVEGERPADAQVTLGTVKDALRVMSERPSGSFIAVVENGEVSVRPLKESIGVG